MGNKTSQRFIKSARSSQLIKKTALKDRGNYLVIPIILIAILLYVTLSPNINKEQKPWFIPDESSYSYFATNLVTHNELVNYNEFNMKYVTSAFTPYMMAYTTRGDILPDHLGFVLILAAMSNFMDLHYVPILFSGITLFVLYALIRSVFDKKIAVLSCLVLAFSSFYVHASMLLFPDVLLLSMVLLIIFTALKFSGSNSVNYYYASLIFAATWVSMRYVNLLFIIPSYIILILLVNKSNSTSKIIGSLLLITFFLSPVLLINLQSFGNFLVYPPLQNSQSILNIQNYPNYQKYNLPYFEENVPLTALVATYFNFELIFKTILKYTQIVNPILILLTVVWLLALVSRAHRNRKFALNQKIVKIPVLLFTFFLLIPQVIFFSSLQNLFAVGGTPSVHDSIVRYLLPAFTVLIVFALLGLREISKFSQTKYLFVFVLFILLVYQLVQVSNYPKADPLGSEKIKENIEKYAKIKADVFANTENNSVIITSVWEKILYPERKVFVYARIPEEIRFNETKRIVQQLIEDNVSVYILNTDTESKYYDITAQRNITFDMIREDLSKNYLVIPTYIGTYEGIYEIRTKK